MRALTFHGIERVSFEAVSDPAIETPGDALVQVQLAGICGSDLHVYHGRETGLDHGTVLGHEFVGEVVELGAGVRNLKRGDLVLSPFTTSCGECFCCRLGLTSRCSSGQLFGWRSHGLGLQGAQAELVRVPLADTTLVLIPEGLTREEALLAGDVFSTGYFCADSAGVGPGSSVAILGCGPVGLMAILAARHLGAELLLAIDRLPERLALARHFGATPLDFRSETVAEEVAAATGGRGVDAVLEAVGSPASTRMAVELVRPGGTVSMVGVHTESHFAVSPTIAYDKNLTLKIGRCPVRGYLDIVLPILLEQSYDSTRVISHRLPLRRGVHGYHIFADKLERCTKVVLEP